MRKFLIASHGTLAGGIKSSIELIAGPQDNLYCIQAYVDENKSIEDDITAILQLVDPADELFVFTDLLGGSVNNQVLEHIKRDKAYVISGFNLPLLLELVLSDEQFPAEKLIETAIQNAKDQMVFVNKLFTNTSHQ